MAYYNEQSASVRAMLDKSDYSKRAMRERLKAHDQKREQARLNKQAMRELSQ